MTRALTVDELNLLRRDGQWSKLYLAVLNPNTIYTARLASLPSSNDNVHTISVNTESGTLSDVKPGMTVYVGTTAGAHNLGMCVIRKTPITGTWYIGLTSQIAWQSTCHLTIVDDFDLWAKHAVLDSGALKMDVDVAYSDQHANFNPVPVLGPHAVAWLTSAMVDVAFDASASWVHGSTITGYSWSAPGSSGSSGMATATPTIIYNAAGYYRVLCTVTAANGKITTGVRHVFVFDDENMPATVFQLAQCVGDYDTGGWMFDLAMEEEATLSDIRDRSLVILFAEDWYGIPPNQTKQSIGPIAGRENIVCVGRVIGQSIRWDRESGFVHFTVQGLHHWLNKIKGFPIQLKPATAASKWTQMPLMTVDRVLWHILYWHSTAIETMDFYPTNDTRYLPEGLSMASSVWGQLADIAFSKIFASPGVDRFGRLFVEIDPQMVPLASRTWPTVMALTDDDWQEGIDLQRVTVEDVSLIRLTSQKVNSSGHALTLYSLSPGHTPRRYGDPEMIDRVLAASQAQSNSLAGLVLGWRTNEFPDVPVIFLQNNRMFDLFPRQYASLTVAAEDTPRGVAYDGNLIPRRISLYFDNETGYMHPEINFEGETFEQISTKGDIPDVDDDDITFPPLPPIPPIPPPPIIIPGTGDVTEGGPPKVLIHDIDMGLLYSENFNDASPEWITVNSGLDETQYQNLNYIGLTPGGGIYVAWRDSNGGGKTPFIAYASAIGGTFSIVEDGTTIAAKYPGITPPSVYAINGIAINPLTGQVAYVISIDNQFGSFATQLYIGSGTSFAAGVDLTSVITVGGSTGAMSFGFDNWRLTGTADNTNPKFVAINSAGSAIVRAVNMTAFPATLEHMSLSTSDMLIMPKSRYLIRITRNGAVAADFTTNIGDGLLNEDVFAQWDNFSACDPTGTFILTSWDTGRRGRSSDGGATWAGIPNLPFGGDYAYAYAGGSGNDSRWVAGKGIIRCSLDFGNTWEEKAGNILGIAPVLAINIVKVIQP